MLIFILYVPWRVADGKDCNDEDEEGGDLLVSLLSQRLLCIDPARELERE